MRCFSLLKSGKVEVRGRKILPKEEVETLINANEVLDAAKQEAIDRIEEAKKECALIHKKAYEAGYQEGLTKFNSHILKIDEKTKIMRHEMQRAMLPLVLQATKRIIGKSIDLNPELIVEIIIQSIKSISQNHQIKLYVNRKDLEHIEKRKEEILSIFDRVDSFSLVERSDVESGGCLIETENGILNASLENQYRALERAFEAYSKQ